MFNVESWTINHKRMKKTKSFTLIEILVVITLIGLIAAGISASYSQFLKQSRDAKRKSDLENVRAALEMYRSNNDGGYYPDQLDDLTDPTVYIKEIPKDPKDPDDPYLTYTPSPDGCTIACVNYTLSVVLESGGAYESTPYGASTVTVVPSPTP